MAHTYCASLNHLDTAPPVLLSSSPDQQAAAEAAGLPRPAVVVVAAPFTQPAEHGVVAAPRFGKATNLEPDGNG